MPSPVVRPGALLALAILAAASSPLAAQVPRFAVELEAGPVWQSRNEARIPNDASATRFSLRGLTGDGPFPAARVYLTWNVGGRHALRALAAPFSITETDTPAAAPIDFAGTRFGGEAPLTATYTFDSYRLTYRYRFRETSRTTAWVGFTAKLRDATVRLEQGATSARKDDLGFVPLLHVAGDLRLAPRWQLGLDADALAGGPGRAVDAALRLGYDPGGRWMVRAGYRTVEGGADVDEVYNFAWLHYAVASLTVRW